MCVCVCVCVCWGVGVGEGGGLIKRGKKMKLEANLVCVAGEGVLHGINSISA